MKITVLPQKSLAEKDKWRVLNYNGHTTLTIYILKISSLPNRLPFIENYEPQIGKDENIMCKSPQLILGPLNLLEIYSHFFWSSVLLHHMSATAKSLQSCLTLCNPIPGRFSRLEHWSELPFPSPMHKGEKWKWSRSVTSNSLRPHGLQPTRLLHPWDFPGKGTGVGCHCLLHHHRSKNSKELEVLMFLLTLYFLDMNS